MSERTEEKNPYGKTSPEKLQVFEEELGWRLPRDYSQYLLDYNGAPFKKQRYISDEGSFTVHTVLGLHDGPEYAQLRKWHRLSDAYDLKAWESKLAHYLCFADTPTGDLWVLDLTDGSVWLYQHDAMSSGLFSMPGRLIRLEDSFTNFLSELLSEPEFDERMSGDPEYDDFKRRLEEIKKRRKQ